MVILSVYGYRHNICGDSFDESLLEGVDTDPYAAATVTGDRSSRSESGVDIRKAYFQQHAL